MSEYRASKGEYGASKGDLRYYRRHVGQTRLSAVLCALIGGAVSLSIVSVDAGDEE